MPSAHIDWAIVSAAIWDRLRTLTGLSILAPGQEDPRDPTNGASVRMFEPSATPTKRGRGDRDMAIANAILRLEVSVTAARITSKSNAFELSRVAAAVAAHMQERTIDTGTLMVRMLEGEIILDSDGDSPPGSASGAVLVPLIVSQSSSAPPPLT